MFQDSSFVSLVEDKTVTELEIWNITSFIYIIPKMTIRSKRKYKLKLENIYKIVKPVYVRISGIILNYCSEINTLNIYSHLI